MLATWVSSCLLLIVITIPDLYARSTTDPVKLFLDHFDHYPDDAVLGVRFDIDGDGQDELFLSYKRRWNDKSGRDWAMFSQDGAGWNPYFIESDGHQVIAQLKFRPDAFYVGELPGRKRGVVSYVPGKGESGALNYIVSDGDTLTSSLEEGFDAFGEDAERYEEYFGANTERPVIAELSISDAREGKGEHLTKPRDGMQTRQHRAAVPGSLLGPMNGDSAKILEKPTTVTGRKVWPLALGLLLLLACGIGYSKSVRNS